MISKYGFRDIMDKLCWGLAVQTFNDQQLEEIFEKCGFIPDKDENYTNANLISKSVYKFYIDLTEGQEPMNRPPTVSQFIKETLS